MLRIAFAVFLLTFLSAHVVTAVMTCEESCANGYEAFRIWCNSNGRSAPCWSLVNAKSQFREQTCLRFCVN